ncbi:DEAD/DEAH box helicase [Sphingomicrobium lutaoense]|uniref:ATP-dependent RNA helicase DeaD n=1 Tax=Sphingomicrobium lutaoense TaxID=515949 RepID=A0A839Z333_9SPHN|nr:DEAD/DEAH box helicase [Sphingomicrobium lutaoense]MBB3764183.1 ATP-dependent RNA helicase DeaD [Sphingomicrobium lutaoense]
MKIPHLPALLSEALSARGYDALTPVQAAVTRPEARGRDLIVSAQTGSGKTVAFGLAMADQLLGEHDRLPRPGAPVALVIAPTRELALQVSRELSWLYEKAGAAVATCVGGMDPSRERRNLRHGAHIVVGTPGRLRDHLERGALDLSALKVAVLDEADEMLDMGFREDLEEILDATPDQRLTYLFSATLPRPIVALAKRYQKDAMRISTIGEDRGHGDIEYQCVTVSPAEIEHAVVNLLRFHEAETAILFCATRENVRHLHAILVERGFSAVAISGEHSQSERNHAMQALRDRRARVCVATDVAARGIDLPSLSLVIHVELPRDAEVLQHRSGRTGRAGKKGTAILIVPYPRRRRVDSMLRAAKIPAKWIEPPSAEMIKERDRERLLEKLAEPVEASDADREMAKALLEKQSAEEIALSLIAAHRSKLPAPEELLGGRKGDQPPEKKRREGFDDCVWFRMNIGRRQNADPRWLLPLICRRGHVTKNEIGAIRIAPNETYFQIPVAIADRFAEALQRTGRKGGEDDAGVVIEPAPHGSSPSPHQPAHRGQIKPVHRANKGRPGGKPHRKGSPKKHRGR